MELSRLESVVLGNALDGVPEENDEANNSRANSLLMSAVSGSPEITKPSCFWRVESRVRPIIGYTDITDTDTDTDNRYRYRYRYDFNYIGIGIGIGLKLNFLIGIGICLI